MKLLVVTDSYPPYHSGGYELRCQDVVERLRAFGHEIKVLSTKIDKKTNTEIPSIKRSLHVDNYNVNIFIRILRDLKDVSLLHNEIKSYQPDAIYLWHIVNMSKAILPYLSGVNKPIIFDEGGKGLFAAWSQRGAWYYFVEHRSRINLFNIIKPSIILLLNIISSNKLKKKWEWPKSLFAYFNSDSSRKWTESKLVSTKRNYTIHSGIDINKFKYRPREKIGNPLKVIVPGRIAPIKGIIDIVPLVVELKRRGIQTKALVVGKVFDPRYYQQLLRSIKENRLQDQIEIKPMVSHEEMVELYQGSDICFFPSIQEVGLSRIPLEAMACGSLIVTYGKEGSAELVEDGVTGYVSQDKNHNQIVKNIVTLFSQPEKYCKLIQNARERITKGHTLESYTNKINKILVEAVYEFQT